MNTKMDLLGATLDSKRARFFSKVDLSSGYWNPKKKKNVGNHAFFRDK